MTKPFRVVCLGAESVVLQDPPRMVPPGHEGIILGPEDRESRALRQLVKDKKLAIRELLPEPPLPVPPVQAPVPPPPPKESGGPKRDASKKGKGEPSDVPAKEAEGGAGAATPTP